MPPSSWNIRLRPPNPQSTSIAAMTRGLAIATTSPFIIIWDAAVIVSPRPAMGKLSLTARFSADLPIEWRNFAWDTATRHRGAGDAETMQMLLEGVPRGIAIAALRAAICATPGVTGVHDFHVCLWPATATACPRMWNLQKAPTLRLSARTSPKCRTTDMRSSTQRSRSSVSPAMMWIDCIHEQVSAHPHPLAQ